jgi:hypothetical protein
VALFYSFFFKLELADAGLSKALLCEKVKLFSLAWSAPFSRLLKFYPARDVDYSRARKLA